MALPKQVEQEMKDVEAMEKSLTGAPEGDEPANDTAPDNNATSEGTPQSSSVAGKETKTEEPEESWAQRYRSLKGHFDAEVPRLHQQNRELVAQIQALNSRLDEIGKADKPQKDERLVTENDEEKFGADLIDLQRRVVKEATRDAIAVVNVELKKAFDEIAALKSMVGQAGGEIANLSFEQRLERAVPNFSAINSDPVWVAWLDEIDEYTGEPRRSYAEYMYQQGNVEKLAQIVAYFQRTVGAKLPEQKSQRKAELERQVQPSKSATATTPSKGDRTYTVVEADRLWNQVRKLYVRGETDKAQSLENELSLATMQGRIR